MSDAGNPSVRNLLLTRRGVVHIPPGSGNSPENVIRTVELELAQIGYVVSARLRERLSRCSLDQLAEFRSWIIAALLAHLGGDQKHEPLFRRFPEGVPADTQALWWQKVLVHFLQAEDQPCLFCRRSGTTHVLKPCQHVICDHCFDGSNYSACPVCEHAVDRSSPFFEPLEKRHPAEERVVFKLLDLGTDLENDERQMFVSLCERPQALSPDDRQALAVIVRELEAKVLNWVPETIPVRENIAIVFGNLVQILDSSEVLKQAQPHLTTATDVLRLIAVMSGTDGSLLPETIFKTVDRERPTRQFWEQIAKLVGEQPWWRTASSTFEVPIRVFRFKMARLSRPLRRSLLALLESFDADLLVEDMLRHRSYWVWAGEFLHPHEYAARFPKVARAFQIVRKKSAWAHSEPAGIVTRVSQIFRKKSDDGTFAPKFRSWNSRVEQAFSERNVARILSILPERPGEFARRLDAALRAASSDAASRDAVIESFSAIVPRLATPVLLTLSSLLPTRVKRAKVRVYWPKGRIALGVSTADKRAVLPPNVVARIVPAIHSELLKRFSLKPHFSHCLIDTQLRTVTVPFNERTASSSAVSVPRGSRIPISLEKKVRLFLHWCEPPGVENTTDLDLSVALYDAEWQYLGVCSYYQLQLVNPEGSIVAQSAGDRRDAPLPDGATEFVDLDCELARALGARFAVMVVNAYAGLPFSRLERGFAGLMLRDDLTGEHFDPRTVKLRFSLDGENGVFMPLVLDLKDSLVHWLDVQASGFLEMNNVESSKSAIARICPDVIGYFESGIRPSLYELAALHAAARCECVAVRGNGVQQFVRQPDESPIHFFTRIIGGVSVDGSPAYAKYEQPILAMLYEGDIDLPDGSCLYALFREKTVPTIGASDLLS